MKQTPWSLFAISHPVVNVSNAFPLEESFSIRAFRKSCASANAGEAPVMGSPPFLTTLTARLIHPIGFREISISCVFMLKAEFSCNGFIDVSFFHSRYLYRREIVRRIDFWHLETEQTPPERVRDWRRKARFSELSGAPESNTKHSISVHQFHVT